MNSDDEKRLAEIRASNASITERYPAHAQSETTRGLSWVLAKLDESERARKEAERQEEWCSRKEQLATMATALEKAEAALAEERAKREAAERATKEAERGWNVCAREARALQGAEERAEAAETRVRELEAQIKRHFEDDH